MTALAAKSLMVPPGMIVDAFRIGTWSRRHDIVMVPGMGVLEKSLPYPDLAFALPTPRDVPVVAGMVDVGVMGYHGSNDDRRQADQLHASEVGMAEFCQSAHSVDVDRLIEQFTELESRSTRLQQMIMERTAANIRLLNHKFLRCPRCSSGQPNRRRPRPKKKMFA